MAVLATTPGEARRAAVEIIQRLRAHGHTAYLAGGCVRDELLGLTPSDYDVATDATPNRVGELFSSASHVGKSFGVMLVRLAASDGFQEPVVVEVATFRQDADYSDARRPDSVSFTDARTDAQRRDFTMNALFLDPTGQEGDDRGVIDFVGGVQDLHAGLIRAVGDPAARLAEDHLRALRAVRFAARLGFAIEPDTARAVRENTGSLQGVSVERIGEEIRRMLTHPSRASAAALLDELGLRQSILGTDATGRGDALLGSLDEQASLVAGLAAWALGVAPNAQPNDAAAWLTRSLALSNEHAVAVEQAMAGRLALLDPGWLGARVARQKRDASAQWFADATELVAAQSPEHVKAIRSRVTELEASFGGLAPPPWVTGRDLIELGAKPGPRFREVLDAVYDEQLEGDGIRSQEAARKRAADLIGL